MDSGEQPTDAWPGREISGAPETTRAPEAPGVPGRVLGVDVGTVRVGLALSDPARVLATPLATMDVPPRPDGGGDAWVHDLAVRLATVAGEHGCKAVVIGLPRALSGRDTASTRLARSVAGALRERLDAEGIPVEFWDERLSSVEADRVMLRAGANRGSRRAGRDRVAAVIILQGWLDAGRR